jgi:hypothetical protein
MAWSEEARQASIEARRATNKAKKSGLARDHTEAANAHSIAAMKLRHAGNDTAAQHHEAMVKKHDASAQKMAR